MRIHNVDNRIQSVNDSQTFGLVGVTDLTMISTEIEKTHSYTTSFVAAVEKIGINPRLLKKKLRKLET